MALFHELKCVPCRKGEPKLTASEVDQLLPQVPDWRVMEMDGMNRLVRSYEFGNFKEALDFTNRIGEIAEKEDHHPLIITEWGGVTVQWWTHLIGGLHKNDFIMAARVDELFAGMK